MEILTISLPLVVIRIANVRRIELSMRTPVESSAVLT